MLGIVIPYIGIKIQDSICIKKSKKYFKEYNANPINNYVNDCAIRAISKACSLKWEVVYDKLSFYAKKHYMLPDNDDVIELYLRELKFKKYEVNNKWYKSSMTISKFAKQHPKGRYIIFTNNHAVACRDGKFYDTWNSGNEVVIAYFKKK